MKSRSFYLTLIFMLVCLGSNTSFGYSLIWTNFLTNQNWNMGSNWTPYDIVPDTTDRVYITMTGSESPNINIGVSAAAQRVYIGNTYSGYTGNGDLNVLGGNLTVNDSIYAGNNGYTGTLYINAGTINVVNKIFIGASAGSTGNVTMDGGLINTKYVELPVTGNTGHLQLDGGVFNCTVQGGFVVGAGGSGDITEGQLELTGNITNLPGFSGWGVPGGLIYSYNSTNNITTITADPQYSPLAHSPIPESGTTDVPVNIAELQWTPALCALSQDFYFGTSYEEVDNATVPNVSGLAGTATSVPTPGNLARNTMYYWRIDSHCGGPTPNKGHIWSFKTTIMAEFCDNFETSHDYLASGTAGTFWDGIIGKDYIYQLTTDNNENAGRLYIETAGGYWQGNQQGALLYKEIVGDWVATVEVTDYSGLWTTDHTDAVMYNNCGIMARVGDIAAAGAGEDWFSIDFFPLYSVGISVRWNDNGVRTDAASESREGWDAGRWLKLTRTGNTFDAYSSHNGGLTWERNPNMPRTRTDMAGLPLQVGIHHATFSGSPGSSEFDDFCISRMPTEKAYSPIPTNGGTMDPMSGIISWAPGDFAGSHNVYFGYDYNDVNEATTIDPEYKGPDNVEGPDLSGRFSYNAGLYETPVIGNMYYWRIDEVNDVTVWKGNIWRFTVQDYTTIDDFERYILSTNPPAATDGCLRKVWIDGYYSTWRNTITGGSYAQSSNDPSDGDPPIGSTQNRSLTGAKSMKLYYDNDGTIGWARLYGYYTDYATTLLRSEIVAAIDNAAKLATTHDSLGLKRNWSSYKLIRIPFYGDPNNVLAATDKMYVGLWDGDNNPTSPVIIEHPDNTKLKKNSWQNWYIPLTSFTAKNANLSLSNIARIHIGIGNRTTPASGGTGAVFFDDIQLLAKGVCIPGSVAADFDGDCTVNETDLEMMTEIWLYGIGNPIIKLDAASLPLGKLPNGGKYANSGTLGGYFEDFNSVNPEDNPTVETVDSVKCITFDGNSLLIADFNAPDSITGNSPFTIIYKVYNPSIGFDEEVFAWAKRGTTARYASAGYSTSTAWGAIAHWGAADMGFDGGIPTEGKWHTIAITYDGRPEGTEYVVVDTIPNAAEQDKTLDIWPDCPVTIGASYEGDPYTEPVTPTLHFSGSLAKLEVYNYFIPPHILEKSLTSTPINMVSSDSTINFKDFAAFASKWLVGPVLLGQ